MLPCASLARRRTAALWPCLLFAALLLGGCSSDGSAGNGDGPGRRDDGGISFRDGVGPGDDGGRDAQAPRLDAARGDADAGGSSGDDGRAFDGPRRDGPAALPDVTSCTPGEFFACQGDKLARCNSTGTGIELTPCVPYGCNASARRCNQCAAGTATCGAGTRRVCSSDGELVTETCNSGCNGNNCAGCTPTLHYRDADRDKFGDAASAAALCATVAGWALNNTDCDDDDANAFPGQTKFFSTPRKGKGGFDYNCDQQDEQAQTTLFSGCGSTCTGMAGWDGTIPACGKAGSLRLCIRIFSCRQRTVALTQTCR